MVEPAGVAAGATRSALTYHFAQEGNPADIAAKEGSQVCMQHAFPDLHGLVTNFFQEFKAFCVASWLLSCPQCAT